VFHLAQAIVGEDGFVGSSEGKVAGEQESCLCILTCRLVLACVGAPMSWFHTQLRGGPYSAVSFEGDEGVKEKNMNKLENP
jgi:hypothetical protein